MLEASKPKINHRMLRNLLPLLLVLFAAFLVDALTFGDLFRRPNQQVIVPAGDGMIITYNMVFHTRYGAGVTLESMNYPHHELIFLTDAQAGISLVLNWINRHWFSVADYVIGVNNGVLIYLLPLASVFLWLCLLRLGVNRWFAIPFALAITYLSPQIFRINCGHYGLGYVFFIPLLIYWSLMVWQSARWRVWSAPVFLVMLAIGFNNPYLMVIGASFLLAFALVTWLFRFRSDGWRRALPIALMALVPVGVIYAVIHSLDAVDDRVKVPWGFFTHRSQFESIFWPQAGKMYDWLDSLFMIAKAPVEGWAYVGLTGVWVLAGTAGLMIAALVRRHYRRILQPSGRPEADALLWTGTIALIYSADIGWYDYLKPIATSISPLLQFRAPGRFAWVFYYCFTLYGAVLIWQLAAHWWRRGRRFPASLVLGLVLAVWAVDVWSYLDHTVNRQSWQENPFLARPYQHIFPEQVDPEEYQALFTLPLDQLWTDKIYTAESATRRYGWQISAESGLPLLNALLSRMSIRHTLESVQLTSDPAIDKKMFHSRLPDERPLLLLHAKDAPLTGSEQLLIQLSDTVYAEEAFALYRYRPEPAYFEEYRAALVGQFRAQSAGADTSAAQPPGPLLYRHFDEVNNSDLVFCGAGAFRPPEGRATVWEGPVAASYLGQRCELSGWVYMDHDFHGNVEWFVVQKDSAGQVVKQDHYNSFHAQDTQEGWLRASLPIDIQPHTARLAIDVYYQFPSRIDEVLFRRMQDTVFYQPPGEEGYFMYNNFKVEVE